MSHNAQVATAGWYGQAFFSWTFSTNESAWSAMIMGPQLVCEVALSVTYTICEGPKVDGLIVSCPLIANMVPVVNTTNVFEWKKHPHRPFSVAR